MRPIFLGAALLMSLNLGPSFAQDHSSAAPNASQPAQSQADSTISTTGSLNNNGQKDRVLGRMGPGIDWDHRKPGRDWQLSPGQEPGAPGRN
jgi:hypothetical protein